MGITTHRGQGGGNHTVSVVTWLVAVELVPPTRLERVRTDRV